MTVDFEQEDFEALQALVLRTGAKGKGDLVRHVMKLYEAIRDREDEVVAEQGVSRGDIGLSVTFPGEEGKRKAFRVEEPDWEIY